MALLSVVACGGSESGSTSDERVCGVAGEVVAAGLHGPLGSSVPAPELEQLRDCQRFRGSLQLHSMGSGAIEALASLRHIEGSLWLVAPGDVRALSALRTIGGRLIVSNSDAPVGLEDLERVGGLWLYDGEFTDLSWLRSLNGVRESMVARRNSEIPAAALQQFAAARAHAGAWVSLTDSVPPEPPDPDAVLCGEPNTILLLRQLELRQLELPEARCTRLLGSLHLPDISAAEQLQVLSSVVEIDGGLSVFRNRTGDFGPLRNLRRIGARFSLHLIQTTGLEGFEGLRDVGELEVLNSTDLTSFDWLPALTTVRETAFVNFSEPLLAEEVTALLSRIEVGGESAVRFIP